MTGRGEEGGEQKSGLLVSDTDWMKEDYKSTISSSHHLSLRPFPPGITVELEYFDPLRVLNVKRLTLPNHGTSSTKSKITPSPACRGHYTRVCGIVPGVLYAHSRKPSLFVSTVPNMVRWQVFAKPDNQGLSTTEGRRGGEDGDDGA